MESLQLLHLARPLRRHRVSNALEHYLRGNPVEFHVTAGGQEREAVSDRSNEVAARAAEQRARATVESELSPMETDEVEHCAEVLPVGATQTASKLLEKERAA